MTLASPAESHTRASVALFKLERFAEAAEEARTALAITPDDNIALRTLARSTLSLGDIEGTIAALTNLLPSSINEAVAGIRGLLRHGEVQAAARVATVSPVRIQSCDSEVLPRIVTLLRQQALRKQNPTQERVTAFEMALSLAPDNVALRIDFLRLLAAAGEAGEFARNAGLVADAAALADASATLSRDVGNRARQAFRDQAWQEAHAWLQAGSRLGLDAAAGDLAERIKARRLAEARKALVAKEPDSHEHTAALLEDYPEDGAARSLHARALIANRHYAQAKTLLQAVSAQGAATADDYVQLARACRASQDIENAIGACFDALALRHEDPTALVLLDHLLPGRE
ncbi:hypothetical protein ACN6KF_000384 [Labrys sp. La1]|uniref:hypothetical protein n=1 Tax=Labrys sp. La1 TaxID=3404917 RepID=UPI003EBAADA7